ncbi:SdpI family protein [Psychroflexus planctonicus]|uniref:Membrane protein n=1 Tax=Psychroflexus planctonicus TaxID=1526575 RepID=A0ABQ1SFT9_9FLAO|nr:SdpI family protein [Psychroflexus planctonicus]GGE36668.1 membrane protein [Psychroflexus planctonicus]
MYFLNPVFIIGISTGPILLITGYIMLKKPPKEINTFYGYRTKRAMASKEQWQFAQAFSSKQLIKSGFWYTLSALPFLFFEVEHITGFVLSMLILAIFVAYPIYTTEKALKEKFKSK